MQCLRRVSVIINRNCISLARRFLTLDGTGDPDKQIIVQKVTDITLIGMNRPDKKNSLNAAMAEQLSEAFENFDNDVTSNTCVLYGTGGNFCAGYDLEEISNYDGENVTQVPQFTSLANKIELSKKVVVASLTGYIIGAGLELALMCDLRIIEDTAMLGFFNRRFGIPILTGGTVRLPAMIGYARAIDLIMTGRKLSAQNAVDWGIANRITAVGTGLGSAMKLAKSVNKFPQKSLLADRASSRFAMFEARTFEEALQFEKDASSHLLFEEGAKHAKKFYSEKIGRHGNFAVPNKHKQFEELDEDLI